MPEHLHLSGVELDPLGSELLRGGVGQRQVHVVAAEQDVIADGDPLERQVALDLADRDQREVGGAAADVAHQDHVTDGELLAPAVAGLAQPRVERRLRLLEQRHVRQARVGGGAHRELARDRVERRRHRQQHLLRGQRRVGMRVVPGRAHMAEIARRGLDRRHARHLGRRLPR